jgi:DNA-damage-inducible protein D
MGHQNGTKLWSEDEVRISLDYQSDGSFRRVVTRAMQACLAAEIPIEENFILRDSKYQLSRFACYLIVMAADRRKPQVVAGQTYLAALAETMQNSLDHADNVDRVVIRKEMTDGMRSLSSTAKQHGVVNYAFFLNAGYRGMYNMDLSRLMAFKGVGKGEILLDRMGKDELAANLFRVTQTDARIKNNGIRGQTRLEQAALDVGKAVRKTMIELSGQEPEHLALAPHIRGVKKQLKETGKRFQQLDGPKKQLAPKKPNP